MEIKSPKFMLSASTLDGYLKASCGYTCPEVCFVGRSNVGKSSFINMLCRQRKLAKTSSLPGRTRLVNLFDVNDGKLVLVDLPGYGYAAAGKSEKEGWGALIEGYLTGSTKLKLIFLLVDGRLEATALDKQMINYMYHYAMPFTVIATKCDKIPRSRLPQSILNLSAGLAVGRDDIIPVSSETGMGRDKILAVLENLCN